jgi:SIR2-like domain
VANERLGPVLTTNIDCLLQIYDAVMHGDNRVFETIEAATSETDAEKLSLYYLHGYLSTDQKDDKQIPFVFTEAEYLDRNDDPYGWANITLHWALREFSIVFIGCSMTDELIGRALYRNCKQRVGNSKTLPRDAEKLHRRHFAVVSRKNDVAYEKLLNETLARLGVWPLWVDNYDK